jgi:hypothetical protein
MSSALVVPSSLLLSSFRLVFCFLRLFKRTVFGLRSLKERHFGFCFGLVWLAVFLFGRRVYICSGCSRLLWLLMNRFFVAVVGYLLRLSLMVFVPVVLVFVLIFWCVMFWAL